MCKLSVRVVPNSSRAGVILQSNGILKVSVMEPPDGGRANRALIKFLEKKLKIKTISIATGMHSKNKVVDFGENVSAEWVMGNLLAK
ncbi:MAG: DUF167 domain-containing protein [Puniceicoccales bacterium]|jgi:uncharacterized protein (TIGR00251 family)|nr:DUF167 domain-containing protein [Puniceicoccales bacterium]